MTIAELYNIKRAARAERQVGYKPEKLTEPGTPRICGMYVLFLTQMFCAAGQVQLPIVQYSVLLLAVLPRECAPCVLGAVCGAVG